MNLKQELLKCPKGIWLKIGDNRDRQEVVRVIKELQGEREQFRFNDDETKFMQCYSDFFDLKDEPGYRIEKRSIGNGKQCEDLYYLDKLVATR